VPIGPDLSATMAAGRRPAAVVNAERQSLADQEDRREEGHGRGCRGPVGGRDRIAGRGDQPGRDQGCGATETAHRGVVSEGQPRAAHGRRHQLDVGGIDAAAEDAEADDEAELSEKDRHRIGRMNEVEKRDRSEGEQRAADHEQRFAAIAVREPGAERQDQQ
jgi:hypothetical protein